MLREGNVTVFVIGEIDDKFFIGKDEVNAWNVTPYKLINTAFWIFL